MADVTLNRKTRKKAFLALGISVVVGFFLYIGFTFYASSRATTDDAQIDADIVMLGAKVGGTLVHVCVKDSQVVKAGDLLAEIDPADYQVRVAQAEAELEAAMIQASHEKGRGSVADTAQIEAARAALARSASEERSAASEMKRAEQLKKDNAISPVELENAQNALTRARANTSQAEAQLKLASDQNSIAEAKVKSAKALLDQAKNQLLYTKIYATRDGTLSRLAVQEGQIIQAGQMIVQLASNDPYVVANFKETQIGMMRPGQDVDIEVDAFPGKEFHGTVESLSPATGARFSLLPPDNASGNFVKVVQRVPVRITLGDRDQKAILRAGLSAYVTVHLK